MTPAVKHAVYFLQEARGIIAKEFQLTPTREHQQLNLLDAAIVNIDRVVDTLKGENE